MGTFGPLTRDSSPGDKSLIFHLLKSFIRFKCKLIVIFLLLIATVSCAPTMKLGRDPQIKQLDKLTANVSGKNDIRILLGEPQGYGAVRSPSFGKKEIWLYEGCVIEGSKAKEQMLMVFLDPENGVYQGNMWFASGMVFSESN